MLKDKGRKYGIFQKKSENNNRNHFTDFSCLHVLAYAAAVYRQITGNKE